MSKLRQTQTNFTAGELAPDLFGRGDLAVYENGAARLRNVFIHPTGGVTRRAGLHHLADLGAVAEVGEGRLVPFAFNTEQIYLLVLTHLQARVFMDGAEVAAFATPWTAAHLPEVAWTQSADTLLIVHPQVEPRRITRTGHATWTIDPWPWARDAAGVRRTPLLRFTGTDVRVQVAAGTLSTEGNAPLFTAGHVGAVFRVGTARVVVGNVASASSATVVVHGTPPEGLTDDWAEEAFSGARGWPATVAFHQNRLAVGGSLEAPNHLWFSRIGDLFNFDVGQALADDAIDFALLSDQVNAIRALFSGRHLQVFTTGAEWTVTGEPLTPSTIQVRRQTRVGSRLGRRVPPVDVDGATLYAAASGRELREFLFTDLEQAYQSTDLALLARHLVRDPVDMAYDPVRRLVHVVMADGTLGTVTNFRREKVTAWTRQETAGEFRAVAVAGGETFALIERAERLSLEDFDDALHTDAALTGTTQEPRTTWSGLDHLEGATVMIRADGAEVDPAVVEDGAVTLAYPAAEVEIGLPFAHIVEPLPPLPEGPRGGGNGRALRLVQVSFRLLETRVLKVDTGRGPTAVPFRRFGTAAVLDTAPQPFTGDRSVRAIGWQRDAAKPLWRVEQDCPQSCTILSVTTETKVTD